MAAESTITVFRGEHGPLTFTHTPDAVTGWALRFTIARAKNAATKLVSLTPSITSTSTYTVDIDDALLDLPPGRYFFDVWRTDAGFEQVLAYGDFVIEGDALYPSPVPPTSTAASSRRSSMLTM